MKYLLASVLLIMTFGQFMVAQPVVYEHSNYGGKSVTLAGCYSHFGGLCTVSWENKISSVSVPEGWSVELYDETGYGGNHYSTSNSVEDLSNIGWNDRVKSIRVVRPNGQYMSGAEWTKCIQKEITKEPKGPKEPK